MKWSTYFQTPEYLERTRMFLILPEYKPLIRAWCKLKDGMRILDVGCGTGYFTRLLAEDGYKVEATGLDIDEAFIEFAKKKAQEMGIPARFMAGDALNLPFEDGTYDELIAKNGFFAELVSRQQIGESEIAGS